MIEQISTIVQSPFQWGAILFASLLIGMSKTGIQGVTAISVPILAIAFGAKPSTGIALPMLCMADLIAVVYYRKRAEWRYIVRLLPMAFVGFFTAIAVDKFIPATEFRYLMALCIFSGLAIMFWNKHNKNSQQITQSRAYSAAFGLLGGFTTMIGNAAGPIMSVYLLSMRLPKMAFVGTAAWFFMLVNISKLPLQAFVWDNISAASLLVNLCCLPFIGLGAVIGIRLVKILPEKGFRTMIVILTIISTIMLILR